MNRGGIGKVIPWRQSTSKYNRFAGHYLYERARCRSHLRCGHAQGRECPVANRLSRVLCPSCSACPAKYLTFQNRPSRNRAESKNLGYRCSPKRGYVRPLFLFFQLPVCAWTRLEVLCEVLQRRAPQLLPFRSSNACPPLVA